MTSIDDNFDDKPTTLSSSFKPASWSSSLSVADAIASYHRSQVIIAGQGVSSRSSYVPQDDEPTDEEAAYDAGGPSAPKTVEDEDTNTVYREDTDVMAEMGWEDFQTPPAVSTPTPQLHFPGTMHDRSARMRETWRSDKQQGKTKQPQVLSPPTPMPSTERTPLLMPRPSIPSAFVPGTPESDETVMPMVAEPGEYLSIPPVQNGTLSRRPSAISIKAEKPIGGKSTFGQTLFNSVAILLGFGMLSEPIAFAYAGWIGGMALLIAAKILAGLMLEDPSIQTYADIGIKAFGRKSRFITSTLFCLELLAVCVVLTTLYGDSLHSIAPAYSANTYKLIGLVIIAPTLFMPLSLLSYASMIGILSTLLVIFVLLFDGLTKAEAPGSLWVPAETSLEPASLGKMGVAFGLLMAGFSGHAVLPSLARDMKEPEHYDKMFNLAFTAATVIYALIGGCGYLMFGNYVSDEVSQDLLVTPGYNVPLNRLVMWSLVIMPLTKFALSCRPVNITFEIFLGIHQPNPLKASFSASSNAQASRRILVLVSTAIERILFAALAISISIFIPEFSSMMAFLGSFSAFMLCVIGPVMVKVALSGRKGIGMFDAILLVSGVIMAAWGTYAAFAV